MDRCHIMTINLMKATDQTTSSNDYAVALALNDCILSLFEEIRFYQALEGLPEFDQIEMNRVYVLLVDELEKLYNRNTKLTDIEPKPVWSYFEFTKGWFYATYKHIEKGRDGYLHRDRVEKLCIISRNESPNFTSKQKELINSFEALAAKHSKALSDAVEKRPKSEPIEEVSDFYIPEYRLTYKPDGTILINNVLKLKRVHAGSTTERLLEEAFKNPNKLFKPNLGQTSRNISTILSSAGFTPTMRELFFPIVSDDKGIVFRPIVTFDDAVADRIQIKELTDKLLELGDIPHLFPYDDEDDDDFHPNISS